MKKSFLLIAAVVFSLTIITACGSDGSSQKEVPTEVESTATTEVIEETQESIPETEVEAKETKDKGHEEDEAKNSQMATIVSVKIIEQSSEYKSLYPDMVQWILVNNSENVIKNYTVSILAYDENGYPVKVEGQYNFNSDFEALVLGEAVNIQPGDSQGENYGYNLGERHGISYAMVLVKELEFYDADTWTNPYYKFWIDKYKEKPVALEELQSMYQ